MRTTWTEILDRFVDNRLVEAAELSAIFAGIGVAPMEKLAPGQIVEAMDLDDVPLAAARLAAVVDSTRTPTEHAIAALDLMEAVRDWDAFHQGEAMDPLLRKLAAMLGGLADLGALMIRQGLKPKLVPIEPGNITVEELQAAVEKAMREARADATPQTD